MQQQIPTFRLLLYLEWILLGFTAVSAVLAALVFPIPGTWLVIVSIVAFGVMGFKLPADKWHKVLYTSLEFGIILLPTIIDSRIRFPSPLGVIAVIRSCQMFKLPGRLIVVVLVLISFLFSLFWQSQPDRHSYGNMGQVRKLLQESGSRELIFKLNFAFSFALVLVFVLLLINALLAERQSRQELAIAHEKLHHYALQIENQATLQERNRIAREIHDSLGHALTAQSIQLENALLFLQSNTDRTRMFLTQAKQLGSQALKEVRQSVAALRTDPLQRQSLEDAIASSVNEFFSLTGIKPDCTISLPHPLTTEVSTAIYRILQEALTNIYKHSAATKVTIQLQEKAKFIHLQVEDNGKGFHPEQNTTGFGLQGMQERTAALAGQFNLISKPGEGCLITARIPLSRI